MQRKSVNLTLTLTPEELQRLRVAAAWSGQTVSAFVRHCVMPVVAEIETVQIGRLPIWTGGIAMGNVKLVNAAMMPTPGLRYAPAVITQDEFVRRLQIAHADGRLDSYIGYPATAEHIERISGVPIPINRVQAIVEAGDTLLVCKLTYRVADPAGKRDPRVQAEIRPEDYEYWIVTVNR